VPIGGTVGATGIWGAAFRTNGLGPTASEMRANPVLADDPERHLTLPQADQARADFAAIQEDLDFINGLARLPTRRNVASIALRATLGALTAIGAVALLLTR
jgi:hypothetical protein